MKKLLSIAAAGMIAAASFLPTASHAAERAPIDYYLPVDIDQHFAVDQLNDLIDSDVLKGTFNAQGFLEAKPRDQISRAQFVALMVRAMNLTPGSKARNFTDVPASHWAYDEIRTASSLGIISGVSATKFGPNQIIQRDQMAVMIYKAFKSTVAFNGKAVRFTDVPSSSWAFEAISKTSGVGIIRGTGSTFKPKDKATRGETAAILHRALFKQTLSVPDHAVLTNVVLNNETESLNAVNSKQYDKLYTITNKYQLGFHRAFTNMNTDEMLSYVKQGYSVEGKLKGTLSVKVISKTKNFAVVDLQGADYEFTATKAGAKPVITGDDISGYVYLRKVGSTWKIYSSDYAYYIFSY